jgi:leucyl-tRNA synthetase
VAIRKINKWVSERKIGKPTVNYHLRDWIFSRQRYWGEPIPMIYCEQCGWVPVPEKDLPIKLPDVKNYKPTNTGESPLAAITNWVNTKCPKCKGKAKRETDTMPNWAGSNWYFLRYIDPKNNKAFADFKKLKYWMPVDWYNGGMEHTTLHLLYSRFWNKFLYSIGLVPTNEPYKKRTSHGMILGEGGEKMSKSKGNVVNPDHIVKEFGADTFRLYEMFMGQFDQAIPWDPKGIVGCSRFLQKVWEVSKKKLPDSQNQKLERLLHQTIKKINSDIELMNFNTAISALMIFINECYVLEEIPRKIWESFLKLIAPFTPFIAEELWSDLKSDSDKGRRESKSIHLEPWPEYDPQLIQEETFELVIQIKGKVRDKIIAPMNISQKEAEKLALSQEKIKIWLKDKKVKKIIFVPNRLINIVF